MRGTYEQTFDLIRAAIMGRRLCTLICATFYLAPRSFWCQIAYLGCQIAYLAKYAN